MKNYIKCLLFICSYVVLVSCENEVSYSEDNLRALQELNDVISVHDVICMHKEQKISDIKRELKVTVGDREKYKLYDNLYAEYISYDGDSALFYADIKYKLALALNERDIIFDSAVDKAERYIMSGMLLEAFDIIDKIDCSTITSSDEARYYHLLNTAYGDLAEFADDKSIAEEYLRKKKKYRNLLLERIGKNDVSYVFVETEILLEQGLHEEVLQKVVPVLDAHKDDIGCSGTLCFIIAEAYEKLGDIDRAIEYYAKSAKYDMMFPKFESSSLFTLSVKLYESGDINTAYKYIKKSMEDAKSAHLHEQMRRTYNVFPIIADAYEDRINTKTVQMKFLIFCLCLISFILLILYLVIVKEKKKVEYAEVQKRIKNEQLMKITADLEENIRSLQEVNKIKDSYLGRYLNMCSDYIDRLETYRKSLRRLCKDGGDIMDALKSQQFITDALDDFYSQFDSTFLDIFPDFIDQLNSLLQEDKRLSYDTKDRILSTELRVMALIRLGINDSVIIARFLRRSVSRVYNCRVKMRNSAIGERDDFENRLMQIVKRC